MQVLEQLSATGQASAHAARAAVTRPLVAVVVVATLVPGGAAVLLAVFARPELAAALAPLVRRLGGEAALHYPGTMWQLPAMLARLAAATGWLLLPLAAGWAATLVAYARGGMSTGAALVSTAERLPRWLLAGAPLVLARDAALAMQARGLGALGHRPMGAAGEVVLAIALDAAVLALAACLLPMVASRDVGVREWPGRLRRAPSWQGPGVVAYGAGFAVTGLVARLAISGVASAIAARHPDAAPLLAAAVAGFGAWALVTFAAGGVVLAAALDDRWA